MPSQFDLRSLFKQIGSNPVRGLADAGPVERADSDEPVVVLDTSPLAVTAAPLKVSGFIDGIQATLEVCHRDRRPVYLYFTAAGAVTPAHRPLAAVEHLAVLCAAADVDWYETLRSTVPAESLGSASPPDLETAARKHIGAKRDQLERTLLTDMIADPTLAGPVVVDGSILTRPRHPHVLGVSKTAATRFLPDESLIWSLPVGWRSPRFQIGSGGNTRFSCYAQLTDKTYRSWRNGLIRLEAWDPDQLEPLAALCLDQRQSATTTDPRGDRHLGAVRAVEEFLRSRRPAPMSW